MIVSGAAVIAAWLLATTGLALAIAGTIDQLANRNHARSDPQHVSDVTGAAAAIWLVIQFSALAALLIG